MCSELIPHERAYSVNFPWQMMTTNFVLNTDGYFQCTLSIPGQFPAFLPHTTVHRALSITVPWSSPCVKLSIGAFYGALSQIGRAWHSVTVTYHPHLCHDHHVHIGTVTYHRPRESKAQVGSLGDNCRGVHYCPPYYNCSPPLPTADLYLNLFCAAGGLRRGGGLVDRP